MMPNPLDIFRKELPLVAQAFDNLIQAIATNKGVDEKTKQLIYIALKAAEGCCCPLVPCSGSKAVRRYPYGGSRYYYTNAYGVWSERYNSLPARGDVFL